MYICRQNHRTGLLPRVGRLFFQTKQMNTLTIRLSSRHIIFCTYNRLVNQMPSYEVYDNDPDISLNANIHKAIKSSVMARNTYSFVEVYCAEPATLVPLKEFEEEDANDIYFFNYPSLRQSNRVFYDTLPYLNAILVFSIDKGVCHSLKEFYPQVKFHCTLTSPVLQHASRYPFQINSPRLYCYVNEGRLTTTVIKDGQLRFMNSYALHHTTDALYYIACVARQEGILPNGEDLLICGDKDMTTGIAANLDKIGQRGFLMKDSEELSHHPLSEIEQFPYDLKVQLLKAF